VQDEIHPNKRYIQWPNILAHPLCPPEICVELGRSTVHALSTHHVYAYRLYILTYLPILLLEGSIAYVNEADMPRTQGSQSAQVLFETLALFWLEQPPKSAYRSLYQSEFAR